MTLETLKTLKYCSLLVEIIVYSVSSMLCMLGNQTPSLLFRSNFIFNCSILFFVCR